MDTKEAPKIGTAERWAWDYVLETDLAKKLSPPPVPTVWETTSHPRRILSPGRPAELTVADRSTRTPGKDALRDPMKRAMLLHSFLHHEMQAAELMCWAVLAFPDAPLSFRKGLLGIALDEVRHMQMYAEHIVHLSGKVGDFPVRDWFWTRVPQCPSPAHFVSTMGMGFEAGNLDHVKRFAARFHDAGDHTGALLQEQVGKEEISHVRFGLRWFREFAGPVTFDRWREHLPPPLTPTVMRGAPINYDDRATAGFDETFLEHLTDWAPT